MLRPFMKGSVRIWGLMVLLVGPELRVIIMVIGSLILSFGSCIIATIILRCRLPQHDALGPYSPTVSLRSQTLLLPKPRIPALDPEALNPKVVI